LLLLLQLLLLLLPVRVPMGKVTAGNLVLVEGLDALISKTATVVGRHLDEEVHVFKPLRFQTRRCGAYGLAVIAWFGDEYNNETAAAVLGGLRLLCSDEHLPSPQHAGWDQGLMAMELADVWSCCCCCCCCCSVMKIATEPLQPSELPKMVEGLRKINKR
jgi:hypothetical protein